jgi:hypothetical protein
MIDGRFDQHFAELFATSQADADPGTQRLLRWTVLAASLAGLVATVVATLLG